MVIVLFGIPRRLVCEYHDRASHWIRIPVASVLLFWSSWMRQIRLYCMGISPGIVLRSGAGFYLELWHEQRWQACHHLAG